MSESVSMKVTGNIRIVKKADDPLGMVRVSCGGGVAQIGGYYCTYRGTKEEAIACLEVCLGGLKGMAEFLGDKEPDVKPDDGQVYA